MIVQIVNFATQNLIFFALLGALLFLTIRTRKDNSPMSLDTTNELKGFAILSIILAHIAYCLVNDNLFLWPLSNWAGVGVDVFFFLSGFGLMMSGLKKDLSIGKFYLKRLSKVIVPVWIFLVVFLILDKIALGISYPTGVMAKSFLGFFGTADIYKDINSPLWFITPLLFYYILFPIFFSKKYPEVSAVLLLCLGFLLLRFDLPVSERVKELWTLHNIGFPLGVFFAGILNRFNNWTLVKEAKNKYLNKKVLVNILRYVVLILLGLICWHFFKQIGTGTTKLNEQLISLSILVLVVFIFILKPVESRFFVWFGKFSFEIYLLHWIIMYRYDFVYRFLPAGVATFVYLFIFLGLGYLFGKIKDLKMPVWKQLPVKK
jgi:peptidoglycan/LPS O-acetylase OafA/YrhL